MLEKFLTFLNEEQLFGATDSVLLTVSGGIDSVVMVDLFQRQGFNYGIAHVNFGLRGAESEGDEAFVRQLAEKNGVRFHTVRFDTLAVVAQEGISVQMAARKLRYDWFETVADTGGYQHIATAHHRDDSLETLLLNLVRGTGLAGLKGISVRQGRIIRPLWFASRTEIGQYAAQQGLAWREDSSNGDDKYDRNRLRHQVIPVLKELNPNVLTTIQQTFRAARGAEILAAEELKRSRELVAEEQDGRLLLNLERLRRLSAWEYRLGEWLRPYGFRTPHLPPVEEAVRGRTFGQVFESATHRLVRDRDHLVIVRKEEPGPAERLVSQLPPDPIELGPGRWLTFTLYSQTTALPIPGEPAVACLDAGKLTWPLRLRPWRAGDRFHPLGMAGTQKVSDYLTNRKVSRLEREQTWVLLSDNRIAWLVGHRPDHSFRITPQTAQILVVRLKKS